MTNPLSSQPSSSQPSPGQPDQGQPDQGQPDQGQPDQGGGAADSRAEQVLSQALRVMAGGGKAPVPQSSSGDSGARRLTTGQLILLAAIVGLLIGICAGFLSLSL